MLEFLFFVTVIGLSFTNVYLVRALDVSMDYGGILDFLRLKRAKKVDERQIQIALESCLNESQDIKVNAVNNAYWEIINSKNAKWLKSIVCIRCMTIRINAQIQILAALSFVLYGMNALIGVMGIIFSIGLNYYLYELHER